MIHLTDKDPNVVEAETLPPAAQDVAVRQETPIATLPPQSTIDFGSILAQMLEKCSDPQFDEKKLVVMTNVVREWRQDDAKQWFARDMASAQAEMQPVVRAAEVQLGKPGENKGSYKYADISDIDEMLRPIMTKYGFSVTYDRKPRTGDGGGLEIIGTLWHRGGHSITASFPLALDSGPGRSNAQAGGSTDTYGRKYILLGFFNVVRKNEDNDGTDTGGSNLTREQALEIKTLVDEAEVDPRSWFSDMLSYEIKQYLEIHQEDFIRLKRALMSVRDANAREQAEGLKL
jgi:hypothetical protein